MTFHLVGESWNAGAYTGGIPNVWKIGFRPLHIGASSAYPRYIQEKWFFLSKHAKKWRTRKKWQHAIEKKISLHNKRQTKYKGAKT